MSVFNLKEATSLPISKPAPAVTAAAMLPEPEATLIRASSMIKFVVSIVVVEPETNKSPLTVNPANVGESVVPRPKEVLAVFPDSYAKAPAPVATINSPSEEAAPRVSRSAKIAPFILLAVIEPASIAFSTAPA